MSETVKQRIERKKKEYQLAVIRTTWSRINGLINVIGLITAITGLFFTLLVYHRVYFNGK